MRKAKVYWKGEEAGILHQLDDGSFVFRYHDTWHQASNKPAISLTLPKSQQVYQSLHLFPVFYHMLPEGSNKQAVCYSLRIDYNDYFGLLLATAAHDTIGAIQIEAIK